MNKKMKKIMNYVLIVSLLSQPMAWADSNPTLSQTFSDKRSLSLISRYDVGSVIKITDSNTGNAFRFRILDKLQGATEGSVKLVFERVDNKIILEFADELQWNGDGTLSLIENDGMVIAGDVTGPQAGGSRRNSQVKLKGESKLKAKNLAKESSSSREESGSQNSDSHSNGSFNEDSVSYSEGLEASFLSGAGTAIARNPALVSKITNAQAEIKQYQSEIKQIQSDLETKNEKVQETLNAAVEQVEKGPKNLMVSWRYAGTLDGVGLTEILNEVNEAGPPIDQQSPIDNESQFGSELMNPERIYRRSWMSTDPEFIKRANEVVETLSRSTPRSSYESNYKTISEQALLEGDLESAAGNQEESEGYLGIAKTAADVLVGLDPFTGTARSIYESITGTNLVTGEELSPAMRTLAILGVVSFGLLIKGPALFSAIEKLSLKIAPRFQKALNFARDFFAGTGNLKKSTDQAKALRKVNLGKSSVNKKWGLTRRHLEKHFTGDGHLSLKKIDPQGNVEKWMSEIKELTQRSHDKVTSNGMLDIKDTFKRADGLGDYKLGIRIAPLEDNTFDLVTILTKQD